MTWLQFCRKYNGYQSFAQFIASDDDFFAVRRFDRLHCRTLLRLQDEVVRLEEALELIDAEFSDKGAKDVDNGTFRRDQKKRKELLEAIPGKLEQYGKRPLLVCD